MNGTMVAIMFIGAALCAVIAAGKGRNPAGWLALGALFPLISFIAILCLPAVEAPTATPTT